MLVVLALTKRVFGRGQEVTTNGRNVKSEPTMIADLKPADAPRAQQLYTRSPDGS
jgi:hypothetical protein